MTQGTKSDALASCALESAVPSSSVWSFYLSSSCTLRVPSAIRKTGIVTTGTQQLHTWITIRQLLPQHEHWVIKHTYLIRSGQVQLNRNDPIPMSTISRSDSMIVRNSLEPSLWIKSRISIRLIGSIKSSELSELFFLPLPFANAISRLLNFPAKHRLGEKAPHHWNVQYI